MKTVFAALGGAIGTTLACWRLVLLLWVLNAAFAWVVSAPLLGAISDTYANNPLSTTLLSSFDNESLVDFRNVEGESLRAASGATRSAGLLWIVLWTILSAGILSRVAERDRYPGLLAACGRYGHRFLWILLVTFVALWGLARFNDVVSEVTTSWLVGDDFGSSAGTLGWTMTAKTLFMLALLGVVLTASRFARLRVVLLGERFVPWVWLRALGSVIRHLPSIGLGRILSLWPLVLAFWLYDLISGQVLLDDALLPGVRQGWRAVLVFQLTQILVQAALVYRMAVDARLWPIVAPAEPTTADDFDGDEAEEEDDVDASVPAPAVGAVLVALALTPAAVAQDGEPPTNPAQAAASVTELAVVRNAYEMDVTLDWTQRTATGRQRATFFNVTSSTVTELWMHLYPAAFSNSHSIWMDGGRSDALDTRGSDEAGNLEIKSVFLRGGINMIDRSTITDTLLHIELPDAVPPGGRVTVEIEFVTRFPRTIARMGFTGDHLDGMQWYPKFCVYDEDGWHDDPFYNPGEFFADFGVYDVTFRYPTMLGDRPVVLEATGVPQDEVTEGDTTSKRFLARDVHDFAFCADPSFETFRDEFTNPNGDKVEVIYLCQPYATPKAEQVLSIVRTCLAKAAEWWMPYPYPRLVVDGLPHSLGGGMEYPMLFTISQRFPNHWGWLVDLTEDPAGVTAHEFGHQYWYGIMATNEVDEAWLDEGVNSWATTELLEAHWPDRGTTDALTFLDRVLVTEVLDGAHGGTWPGGESFSLQEVVGWHTSPFHDLAPEEPRETPTLLGWRFPTVDDLRLPDMSANRPAWRKARYFQDARARPLSAPSREFTRGYGSLVYRKAELVLHTLQNLIGDERMRQVMRTFVERHRFEHPTRGDFLAIVSELTGGAHDALLIQLLETNGTVDYAVEEVSSERKGIVVGYTAQVRPSDSIGWNVRPEDDDEPGPFWERAWSAVFETPFPGAAEDAQAAESGDDDEDAGPWVTRYVVRQLGEVEAPVDVEARFDDGTIIRETWDGAGGYQHFRHETDAKLVEVVVDPDRLFAVDLDRNNNGHLVEPATETVRTLSGWAHFWTQNHLNGWSLAF